MMCVMWLQGPLTGAAGSHEQELLNAMRPRMYTVGIFAYVQHASTLMDDCHGVPCARFVSSQSSVCTAKI